MGAGSDDSTYTGVFAPSDPDYGSALDSDAGSRIGAAYVYRRSDADLWVIEAFIKAPRVNSEDIFGSAVALSANGSTLAVSAPNEDSSYTGVFAPSDPDYGRALDSNGTDASGAAYVYRRLDAGLWAFETFVKAPATGDDDFFGNALALSDDGSALAVSAHGEGSGYTGAFAPSDPDYGSALDSDGTDASGAVTVYRRSSTGQWMVKAFVKAPQTLRGDRLGCRAGTVAFALDRGRLVLAAGAPSEQSQAVGVFVPNPNDGGAAYNAALVNGLPAGPGDRGCLRVTCSQSGRCIPVLTVAGQSGRRALIRSGTKSEGWRFLNLYCKDFRPAAPGAYAKMHGEPRRSSRRFLVVPWVSAEKAAKPTALRGAIPNAPRPAHGCPTSTHACARASANPASRKGFAPFKANPQARVPGRGFASPRSRRARPQCRQAAPLQT